MTTEVTTDLAACLALVSEATPGPWKRDYDNDTGPNDDYYVRWETAGPAQFHESNATTDADFIAAAVNYLRTNRDRLLRAEAMQWQPIGTAPKDGSRVLLANEHGAWVGEYCPVYRSGYRPDNPWATAMLNHDHLPKGARHFPPTHWMPLPSPPGTGGG